MKSKTLQIRNNQFGNGFVSNIKKINCLKILGGENTFAVCISFLKFRSVFPNHRHRNPKKYVNCTQKRVVGISSVNSDGYEVILSEEHCNFVLLV